jgi:hypothetical protein
MTKMAMELSIDLITGGYIQPKRGWMLYDPI